RRALADAGLSVDDLDEVIVVGGAARMPAIGAMLRSFTGNPLPKGRPDRDGIVARGAAIQAAALLGDVCDALVWDVTPTTLTARTPDGARTTIVRRNTATPVTHTVFLAGVGAPA